MPTPAAAAAIRAAGSRLGDWLVLTTPRTGDVVTISPVRGQPLYGAVRPTG